MSIKNVGKGLGRWATVCGLVLGGLLPGRLPDPVTRTTSSRRSACRASPPLPAASAGSVSASYRSVATNSSGLEPEVLRVGDSLTVTFTDTPTPIPPFEEKIKEDGTITLALNQTFKADGKTRGDLEKEIRECYVPDYFKYMTVTVKPAGKHPLVLR